MPPTPSRDPEERLQEAVLAYLQAADAGQPLEPSTLLEQYEDILTQLQDFFEVETQLAPLLLPLHGGQESPPPIIPVGDFGRYELLAEIGRGGMGVVYKARLQELDRLVALKIVRAAGKTSAAELERFRNETETVAGLDHPHIVPVYDVGEHAGQLYYTMPLLEGGSLARQAERFAEYPREAAELVATIARAVHYAHQRGVLHRDIKPSNILLDGADRPFVADFGLAKRLDAEDSLTETGAVLGTPAFISPEQAMGRGRAVTTASDVYGLGAVLYMLLAGRPPFHGATLLETLSSVQQHEAQTPATYNPLVDRDLAAICLKCLEKEPQRRYTSAEALAEDLDRWRAGLPVQARALGRLGRTWRWCRRNPLVAGLAAALALFIVSGMTAMTAGYFAVRAARDEAQQHAGYLRRRIYTADMRQAHGLLQRGDSEECQELLTRYVPTQGEADLRGYEWHLLQTLVQPRPREILTYQGHRGIVFHAAYAPDGKTVASGGDDREIHVWDAATGTVRGIVRGSPENPEGHTGDVNWLAFSPDGRWLVSAGEKGVLRLWDAATLEPQGTLAGHEGPVECVAFTPDGTRLISGGLDGILRVWNMTEQALEKELQGHSKNIECLVISPDGNTIYSGSYDGTVRAWDLTTGREQWQSQHLFEIRGACLSPGGGQLAIITTAGNARLDARSGELLHPLFRQNHHGRGICWSPNGAWVAACGVDGGWIELFAAATGDILAHFPAQTGTIWSVISSPDSRRLLTTGSDRTVKVWDIPPPSTIRIQTAYNLHLPLVTGLFDPHSMALALPPPRGTGATLVVRSLDGSLTEAPHMIEHLDTGWMAWLLGGERLLFSKLDGTISSWDRRSGRKSTLLPPPSPPETGWPNNSAVNAVAMTPNGILCIAHSDGSLRFADGKGQDRSFNDGSIHWIMGLLPLDQRRLLVLSVQSVRCWDLAQSRWQSHAYPIAPRQVSAFALARERQELALGLAGGGIELLDALDGAERGRLDAHKSRVTSLAYSPDGKLLISGSRDGTVRLWDLATLQEFFVLEDRRGQEISSLCFSPDGEILAIAGRPLPDGSTVSLYYTRSRNADTSQSH